MSSRSHYLAGVPSLPEAVARRLEDQWVPLTAAEQAEADWYLARITPLVREARARENDRRGEPIEPEPPYGSI
jgi:hypothetical protein